MLLILLWVLFFILPNTWINNKEHCNMSAKLFLILVKFWHFLFDRPEIFMRRRYRQSQLSEISLRYLPFEHFNFPSLNFPSLPSQCCIQVFFSRVSSSAKDLGSTLLLVLNSTCAQVVKCYLRTSTTGTTFNDLLYPQIIRLFGNDNCNYSDNDKCHYMLSTAVIVTITSDRWCDIDKWQWLLKRSDLWQMSIATEKTAENDNDNLLPQIGTNWCHIFWSL